MKYAENILEQSKVFQHSTKDYKLYVYYNFKIIQLLQ